MILFLSLKIYFGTVQHQRAVNYNWTRPCKAAFYLIALQQTATAVWAAASKLASRNSIEVWATTAPFTVVSDMEKNSI